jgi:hypothetical protein
MTQPRRLPLDIHNEVVSSRIDQPGQGRESWLSPSGFVRADHALRNTRLDSQFRLRQARADSGPPQHTPGRFINTIHNDDYSGSSILWRIC